MNIPKDGKLNQFDLKTLRKLEDYGWDVQAMADDLLDADDKIAELNKEISRLQSALETAQTT